MAQSSKRKKRKKKDALKVLYTEGALGTWALAEEVGNGCMVLTENSTTFIPEAYLIHLIDDYDRPIGWAVEDDCWRMH